MARSGPGKVELNKPHRFLLKVVGDPVSLEIDERLVLRGSPVGLGVGNLHVGSPGSTTILKDLGVRELVRKDR